MILGYDDIFHYIKTNKLEISGMNENTIRENGIDCKIGSTIAIDMKKFHKNRNRDYLEDLIVDTHDIESVHKRFEIKKIEESIVIPSRTNILLVTEEVFKVPDDIMGFCCLRSTVARNGFIAPITIIDAGFEGTLTIECFYGGNNPIKIYKGDRFLHVVFAKISSPVSKPYSGVYKGQTDVRLPKCID